MKPRERTRRRQDIAHYAHHEIRHACVECGASFPAPLTDDHTIGSAYEGNRHGLTRTFWLANAVQAEAISSGVVSYAPSAAAGVGFIASRTPARCAIATTLALPTCCAKLTFATFKECPSTVRNDVTHELVVEVIVLVNLIIEVKRSRFIAFHTCWG